MIRVLILLLLVGCGETEEGRIKSETSKQQIEAKLPKDCIFNYAGEYITPEYTHINVVYVTCPGITTLNTAHQMGKFQQRDAVVQIDVLQTEIEKLSSEKDALKSALSKLTEEDRKVLGLKQ